MAQAHTSPAVTGADGELIARFVAALKHCPVGTHVSSSNLALAIGGQLGGCLVPLHLDVGMAEDQMLSGAVREGRKSVDLAIYVAEIENRLRELVRSGLAESFVVAAARNYLSTFVDRMRDFEAFEPQRADQRERLQRLLEAGDADDETLVRYRMMLELLQPMTHDEQASRLADQTAWANASTVISDAVIAEWIELRFQTLLSKQG